MIMVKPLKKFFDCFNVARERGRGNMAILAILGLYFCYGTNYISCDQFQCLWARLSKTEFKKRNAF